jgi:hypothetical protein
MNIHDAEGQIRLGQVAGMIAAMVLDGYEYNEIVKDLHAATEAAINGIIEGEQQRQRRD